MVASHVLSYLCYLSYKVAFHVMQDATLATARRCQHRLWELGFPVLPVCQLHWSNFEQQEDSEQQGTSEHEGASEQQGSSMQQAAPRQQGFFEQDTTASKQQDASEQQGASEQGDSSPSWQVILEEWMEAHNLTMDSDCFVIKPADETQGAGVLLVNDFESLELHALRIFEQVSSLSQVNLPVLLLRWLLLLSSALEHVQ